MICRGFVPQSAGLSFVPVFGASVDALAFLFPFPVFLAHFATAFVVGFFLFQVIFVFSDCQFIARSPQLTPKVPRC